jgi:hypothetical protein
MDLQLSESPVGDPFFRSVSSCTGRLELPEESLHDFVVRFQQRDGVHPNPFLQSRIFLDRKQL